MVRLLAAALAAALLLAATAAEPPADPKRLKLAELVKLAREAGADADAIDAAMDGDAPRKELASLLAELEQAGDAECPAEALPCGRDAVSFYLEALPGCPATRRGAVRDFAGVCLVQLQTSPQVVNAPQLAASGDVEFIRSSIGTLLELAQEPSEPDALMLWANLLQPTRPQRALEAYQKAREAGRPADAAGSFFAHDCYLKLGRYEEARAAVLESIELEKQGKVDEAAVLQGESTDSTEERLIRLRLNAGKSLVESLDVEDAGKELAELLGDYYAAVEAGKAEKGAMMVVEIQSLLGVVGYWHGALPDAVALFRDCLNIARHTEFKLALDLPQLAAQALWVGLVADLVAQKEAGSLEMGSCVTLTRAPAASSDAKGWRPIDASDAVLGKVAESVSGVDGLFEDPFLVPVLEEGLEDGSSVRHRLSSLCMIP